MSSSSDNPGPSRSKRRYMPGRARSRTIELGTLSEIEEDLYQNRKDLEIPTNSRGSAAATGSTLDDLAIQGGSIRKPTIGSVRSLARHLSERHGIEHPSKSSNRGDNIDRVSSEENGTPLPSRRRRYTEGDTEKNRHRSSESDEDRQRVRRSPRQVKNRQYAQEMRVQRSVSDVRGFREPFSKWSPAHSPDDKWCLPAELQQHTRSPSGISRQCSMVRHPLSRSASMVGRVLMYDPRTMSLMEPCMTDMRMHDMRIPDYPIPVWVPQPAPVFIPMPPGAGGHPSANLKSLPYLNKGNCMKIKSSSSCNELFCGGFACFLWYVVSILLLGAVAILILSLLNL